MLNRSQCDQPKFSVDVRIKLAILTIAEGSLLVAASGRDPCRLPGDRPDRESSLDEVARFTLRSLAGPDGGYMEQLYTFSSSEDDRAEIVVSYLALVSGARGIAGGFRWEVATAARSCLEETDQTVLDYALIRLRGKIGYTTIAFHLMAESFALSDLQHTYETILDRPLDPRNFRRRISSSGLVQSENRKRREGSHRPATLYRFAGNHDPASYLTPGEPGAGDASEANMPAKAL